jgi:hypothetical protein
MPLSPHDEADLRDLAWHWDNYDFSVCEDVWSARPQCDRGTLLTADSAAELREKVGIDYGQRQLASQPQLGDRMST